MLLFDQGQINGQQVNSILLLMLFCQSCTLIFPVANLLPHFPSTPLSFSSFVFQLPLFFPPFFLRSMKQEAKREALHSDSVFNLASEQCTIWFLLLYDSLWQNHTSLSQQELVRNGSWAKIENFLLFILLFSILQIFHSINISLLSSICSKYMAQLCVKKMMIFDGLITAHCESQSLWQSIPYWIFNVTLNHHSYPVQCGNV